MKAITTFIAGLILAAGGLVLRLNALVVGQDHTAPVSPGYVQEFWQQTWIDLGNLGLAGGLAIIVLALHHWIKNIEQTRTTSQKEEVQRA